MDYPEGNERCFSTHTLERRKVRKVLYKPGRRQIFILWSITNKWLILNFYNILSE